MKSTISGRLIIGLVLGSVAGAAVGLLVAPKTGKEAREIVRHKTGDYAGTLRERFGRDGTGEQSNRRVEALS